MFDLPTYKGLLAAVDAATTATQKGDRFEELCAYLFTQLTGVSIEGRDAVISSAAITASLPSINWSKY